MGAESGVAENGSHSHSLEAGVTALEVAGLALGLVVAERRFGVDNGS